MAKGTTKAAPIGKRIAVVAVTPKPTARSQRTRSPPPPSHSAKDPGTVRSAAGVE